MEVDVDVWTHQDMNDLDGILELCQGSKLYFFPHGRPPFFMEELYKVSRGAFAK